MNNAKWLASCKFYWFSVGKCGIFPSSTQCSFRKFTKIRHFDLDRAVADKGVGEFMDSEGNGVNPGEGNGGGPGPPSGEQDKQLISNSGGDNTLMWQPGRRVRRDNKDPSCTEFVIL